MRPSPPWVPGPRRSDDGLHAPPFPVPRRQGGGLEGGGTGGAGAAGRPIDEDDVVAAVHALRARPEREHRYAGCEIARLFAPRATPELVDHFARWMTTGPWWDTCDPSPAAASASWSAGTRPCDRPMDRWLSATTSGSPAASSIHMGGWRDAIDRVGYADSSRSSVRRAATSRSAAPARLAASSADRLRRRKYLATSTIVMTKIIGGTSEEIAQTASLPLGRIGLGGSVA